MRNKFVRTSNVVAFHGALKALRERSAGEEGMGLLWGLPGAGKSTTIANTLNTHGGIHLRARVTWTVTAMLRQISQEIGVEAGRYRDPMIEAIVERLAVTREAIFVDEADYLFRQTDMLDALRDIYDVARAPVVLIGMEDIARRIRSNERFNRFRRRITQWIEFSELSLVDTQRVAEELCEVGVGSDLVERLHLETAGNIGNIVIGLGKIERFGKGSKLDEVTLSQYGNTPLN